MGDSAWWTPALQAMTVVSGQVVVGLTYHGTDLDNAAVQAALRRLAMTAIGRL